jgi:hypothetical protein
VDGRPASRPDRYMNVPHLTSSFDFDSLNAFVFRNSMSHDEHWEPFKVIWRFVGFVIHDITSMYVLELGDAHVWFQRELGWFRMYRFCLLSGLSFGLEWVVNWNNVVGTENQCRVGDGRKKDQSASGDGDSYPFYGVHDVRVTAWMSDVLPGPCCHWWWFRVVREMSGTNPFCINHGVL